MNPLSPDRGKRCSPVAEGRSADDRPALRLIALSHDVDGHQATPPRREPRSSEPASYPSQIWLLLGGSFLVRALGFAYPFLSYFVAQRGHGPTFVSFVLAAFGAGWVLGQLVCGSLVDRIGGRLTLVAAMVAAAAVLCVLAASHTVPMLVGCAVLFGVAFDAPRPVISAAIAELIPDSGQRAKIDAFRYGWVVNAGGAITGALGGLLAIRIGVPALFLFHAAACAMFALRRRGSCLAACSER